MTETQQWFLGFIVAGIVALLLAWRRDGEDAPPGPGDVAIGALVGIVSTGLPPIVIAVALGVVVAVAAKTVVGRT